MLKLKLLLFLVIATILAACSSSPPPAGDPAPASFLVDKFENLNLTRSSEPATFVGDALYEHINGGAEVFHLYAFEEVATTYYKKDSLEVMADIYKFADSDGAYGLFTTLRPPEPQIEKIGVEAIISDGSIDFIKGPYFVKLVAYEPSPEIASLLRSLAVELEKNLPGTTELPGQFGLLPTENAVPHTEKLYASSYLSWQPLKDVYTKDYNFENEISVIFLAEDKNGKKYIEWLEKITPEGASKLNSGLFPFDDGHAFRFEHSYYGTIIAGLKNGNLAGIVGYSDSMKDFFEDWINKLQ